MHESAEIIAEMLSERIFHRTDSVISVRLTEY